MALPKIQTPIFELTLPSTGQQVKYRPFLVKEQKILLMALESKESTEMLRAIKQIITNCAIDEIKVDQLPMFDLEYFFLRLRAKSIGEEIELSLSHFDNVNKNGDTCEHKTKYTINLMEVEVEKEDGHDKKVILDETSGVGVVLKYPTMALADKMQGANNKNQMDAIVDIVCQSIDYIFDNESTYPAKDQTKQELTDFINNLSQEQFAKLNEFFNTMPKLRHTIRWECEKCGTRDSITLEGMANFFG